MFTKWAEKSGLFGILAPRKQQGKEEEEEEEPTTNNSVQQTTTTSTDSVPPSSSSSNNNHKNRGIDTGGLSVDDYAQSLVEGQYQREQTALAQDSFCKLQRVQYYHKHTDSWIGGSEDDDVVIVGVHHDDGHDKPYYTIQYHVTEDTGERRLVEKQTTGDRLRTVPWNAQKTWNILSTKRSSK